ncbi:ATP-dependent protease ATPase subunit HslU [Pirellulaceae bacterium]|nr:ATP-dependent protease ATPase subunit HslU [Pirellulaceae bacterium]
MTPREIVKKLDAFIVGQNLAKRSVAVAIRNRWRRQQIDPAMRDEVAPKNILMSGPTGVGKTEIARRLARLTGAPFIKVEATKYTEVGYYGRDVESMVRELLDNSIALVRQEERVKIEDQAAVAVENTLLDLLVSPPPLTGLDEESDQAEVEAQYQRTRQKMRAMLLAGELDQRTVEITTQQKSAPMMIGNMGMEGLDMDLQGMLDKMMPKASQQRGTTVAKARETLLDQKCDELLDVDEVHAMAIDLAENMGIVFLDEMDKVIGSQGKSADVSRQGVQRDLLPIVEGTTVQTKYGYVRTDHILFIAAGAFHATKPSDLMPELQGRFPIRVELDNLSSDDFRRILTEPKNSLVKQYVALLATEGVELDFTDDAVVALAEYAFEVNQRTQNIGARRLHTILERVLEELSFEASEIKLGRVEINRAYVSERLQSVVDDEDLSNYIL